MVAPSSWYDVAKDFQTAIAAFVALCAAGLTFYSAQRVARIQSRTTRELAESQFSRSVNKEKEEMARQRAATLMRIVAINLTNPTPNGAHLPHG